MPTFQYYVKLVRMETEDTLNMSNDVVVVMNALADGGPKNLDQATDMLWVLAGELSENANLIKSLRGLVNRKQLTGLLNDRGFNEETMKEQNRVDRGQSIGGVIISIDLAGFKRINDEYNMGVGDQALQTFANAIKDFGFRDTDIIGNPGGDEFVIIVTNTSLDYPKAGNSVLNDFSHASGLWAKIDALNKATQSVPFEFEYNGKMVEEHISARTSVADYDANVSIKDALANADEKAKLIKKFTKQYIRGGR